MSRIDEETIVVVRSQLGDAKYQLQDVARRMAGASSPEAPALSPSEIASMRQQVLDVVAEINRVTNTLRRGVYEDRPIRQPADRTAKARDRNFCGDNSTVLPHKSNPRRPR